MWQSRQQNTTIEHLSELTGEPLLAIADEVIE
jgi:hypothetical protein